jgi:hypothetical protein
MAHTTSEIVAAYFEYQRTQNDALHWAWDLVDAEGFDDPLAKWSQILALLEAATDEWQVGLLAAGPLEDLIRRQSPAVIHLVEADAPRNARLRAALGGTWLRGDTIDNTIADRVEQVIGRRLEE